MTENAVAQATITISLRIENRYEDTDEGDEIITTATDKEMPAPPTLDANSEEYQEWAYEHVYPLTGTGRTEGDSFYDVDVTACSDPTLVGRTFEWGY